MKYRKKPVVIEAIQWTGANVDEVLGFILAKGEARRDTNAILQGTWTTASLGNRPMKMSTIQIDTLEGTMRADKGDWIIKGVKDEFYPCKPDVFIATYDPA